MASCRARPGLGGEEASLPAPDVAAQRTHSRPLQADPEAEAFVSWRADIGEAALGRRLGRNIVTTLVRAIDFMLPSVMHVGGTRFLQVGLGRLLLKQRHPCLAACTASVFAAGRSRHAAR